ncbi:NAD-dependent malic enzyme [Fontivita pretiosa]|uniref:NAD-dependent malic enzyme n=1 Tax=Fontivita pretiosa TaxID=2989684 RepID=UPI003D168752
MEKFELFRDSQGRQVLKCRHRGLALLNHPMYNRGSAFTLQQREMFGLRGLLPARVSTLEQQVRRVYQNICRSSDPIQRYITLSALHDRNEVLFFRVLLDHLEEFLPIVYTPTVGQVCQEFSRLFRRPRGMWITPRDRGQIDQVLGDAPFEDVRLIVVTDNERILGLGDQGCGGMAIPVGKLALYTVAAGIHPAMTLPVSLDVGTDNQELRADELYLGWESPRLRGAEYDALVDEFVTAVKRRFPRALLQWEDFKKQNAFDLLDRYRHALPSFNDDIQGTAAVALAGILAAGRISGTPIQRQRVVILGAGAAGIGIARQLRDAMRRAGLQDKELIAAIAVLDSRGLLVQGRELREAAKRDFAWPAALAAAMGLPVDRPADLLAVIHAVKPTVLIGTTGEPGAFTEPIVRAMAQYVQQPAIFPFSNPTSRSEAIPRDLVHWTNGRALVATGSPFPPVVYEGRTIRIGQGNNVYVFPGVGLGALVAEARVVTDAMFTAAATTLAECVSQQDLDAGALYPPVTALRHVSARIAEAVVREARDSGVGRDIPDSQIPRAVADFMWTPAYPELLPA